jgi:hypothetical protein
MVVPIQRPSFDPLIRNEREPDGIISRQTIAKHLGHQRNAAFYESFPMFQLVGQEAIAEARFSEMISKPECVLGAVCIANHKDNGLAV